MGGGETESQFGKKGRILLPVERFKVPLGVTAQGGSGWRKCMSLVKKLRALLKEKEQLAKGGKVTQEKKACSRFYFGQDGQCKGTAGSLNDRIHQMAFYFNQYCMHR